MISFSINVAQKGVFFYPQEEPEEGRDDAPELGRDADEAV
jgi:hypothetical protein